MGNGEFVGNESIHWRIRHRDDLDEIQRDAKRVQKPRKGINVSKNVLHGRDPDRERTNTFEVRMRFDSRADAENALAKALAALSGGDGAIYATVIVPAPVRPDPPDDPDVNVTW